MEKKLLLAVVISIVVMLVYPLFLAKISPPPMENNIQGDVSQSLDNTKVKTQDVSLVPPDSNRQLPEDAVAIPVAATRYELVFSNIGGGIQKVSIKDSKRFENDLVEGAVFDAGILAIEGDGPLRGLSSQPFIFQRDTNTLYAEKDGLRIEKTVRFLKDQYGLRASIALTNISQAPEPVSFQITTASNISSREIYESRYIEAGTCQSDDRIQRLSGGKLKKDNLLREQGIKWLYLKNKYYSIICEPEFNASGVFTRRVADQAIVGFIVDDKDIRPGETRRYEFKYYIGPTEIHELEKVDKSFSRVLNFGIFTSIGMILLSVLKFFYSIFHNYGVAILLLTCCISMVMFPLTFKSMKSMRKLQELQPKIENIRAEHKDNPQKLNKEIMELYRRHKANPMGGCMPMFLQMPIFIALYQTLMRSVELKGADFLWIKDLSMPDAAFHLPFSLPFLGNAINILPILMIGAMIIQQKMSQLKTAGGQTDQQKMMSSIMPVMFGFIFYNLPSGLVLYWLTNTLLTSALQFSLLKKT
ncbi:MAG: membrane protein insertase YidC [Candidatus Omnitrophica bacterium]|nr:membrane protein insertase YidC [Candidatus Omnitrophota bacterium]